MVKKVLKFGGTSVGTIERIQHVAKIIEKERQLGNKIIAVVSAMAGKTNELIELSKEIQEILHDINLEGQDAELIRAVIVLSQMNLHIWHNESNYRKGIKDGNNLELTHGLNGIRNTAKNIIQEKVGGRKDYKIDCLAAEFKDWEISWSKKNNEKQNIQRLKSLWNSPGEFFLGCKGPKTLKSLNETARIIYSLL